MAISIRTQRRRHLNGGRIIDCWTGWDSCGGGVVTAHCAVKHGRKFNNYLWIECRFCSKMRWQRENFSSNTGKIKTLLDESTIVILLVNSTSIARKGPYLVDWKVRRSSDSESKWLDCTGIFDQSKWLDRAINFIMTYTVFLREQIRAWEVNPIPIRTETGWVPFPRVEKETCVEIYQFPHAHLKDTLKISGEPHH